MPSTYRHTAAAARPLPAAIEPLLVSAVDQAVSILDKIAPIGTEERRTEWIGRSFPPRKGRDIGWPDDQHGRPPLSAIVGSARFPFSSSSYTLPGLTYRQALKPRLLLYGKKGMALSAYLGPAICERLEGWRYYVRSVDLASLIGDAGRVG